MKKTGIFFIFLLFSVGIFAADTQRCGEVNGCSVCTANSYIWRDFQPIVEKPGKDGGNPAYVKVGIKLDNSNGGEKKLTWKAYIRADSLAQNAEIIMIPADGTSWIGTIRAGEVVDFDLISHEGPYLPVGTDAEVYLEFMDQTGASVFVSTDHIRVDRTD